MYGLSNPECHCLYPDYRLPDYFNDTGRPQGGSARGGAGSRRLPGLAHHLGESVASRGGYLQTASRGPHQHAHHHPHPVTHTDDHPDPHPNLDAHANQVSFAITHFVRAQIKADLVNQGFDVLDFALDRPVFFSAAVSRTALPRRVVPDYARDYRNRQFAFFAQDTFRLKPRWTFNVGLLASNDTLYGQGLKDDPSTLSGYSLSVGSKYTMYKVPFSKMIQPRLGFAYDIKGDGKWKAYGSYGWFYDITKLELPRGSFGGDRRPDELDHEEALKVAERIASISPGVSGRIQPLIPALQSNWLTYHVITCFLGYAAFAVACGVSIMYLIKAAHDEGGESSGHSGGKKGPKYMGGNSDRSHSSASHKGGTSHHDSSEGGSKSTEDKVFHGKSGGGEDGGHEDSGTEHTH